MVAFTLWACGHYNEMQFVLIRIIRENSCLQLSTVSSALLLLSSSILDTTHRIATAAFMPLEGGILFGPDDETFHIGIIRGFVGRPPNTQTMDPTVALIGGNYGEGAHTRRHGIKAITVHPISIFYQPEVLFS